jgi:hypothetical protein
MIPASIRMKPGAILSICDQNVKLLLHIFIRHDYVVSRNGVRAHPENNMPPSILNPPPGSMIDHYPGWVKFAKNWLRNRKRLLSFLYP